MKLVFTIGMQKAAIMKFCLPHLPVTFVCRILYRSPAAKKIPFVADYVTTCEDVELFAKDGSALDEMLRRSGFAEATDHDGDDSMGSGTADMMKAMFTGTPLHSILSFSSEELTYEDIQDTIRKLNEAEKNNNY